ncbi:RNA-binding protein [Thiohalobacter sp. IOR34]|uniref:RNA recognition motif domain-containing protein n=1 Tax=Thiohalobacter sp. IOR34 TaxID=3057176 RepID=UPI0025B12574|nr:RNA-binding protein [Thiohalobacter sp. IOR34]WJW75604.1 RNA-binding protein [Thiohalobacter sp. IOR34]
MMLYLGNLPRAASEQRLARLMHLPRGALNRLRIIKKPGRDGDTIRYGLLYVDSEAEAKRLRVRSRGLQLDGQPVEVREFQKRVASNERRALDWRSRPWPHKERRLRERRRPN